MKRNHVLWILALLVINTGWYNLSKQSVNQEINRPGADFAEVREAKIGGLMGDEADFEIEHCFDSLNGGEYNVSIQVKQNSLTLYDWNGTTENDCVKFKSSSGRGEIKIITEIEDGVTSTTNVKTWPLENLTYLGIVIFSVMTVTLAFAESFVRKYVIKKIEKKVSEQDRENPQSRITHSPPTGIWQDPLRPN